MEKSAGFVIYKKKESVSYLLLLKYPSREGKEDYWGLPKGHIEKGEKPLEAAYRELFEETGIKKEEIKRDREFKEWMKYIFKEDEKTVFKMVLYFLAETKKETIEISNEHTDYRWVDFEEVEKLVPFKDTLKVIEKAKRFI